jgi:crotonobetainyl-CoA:carnitine CoA-transferase CaiB-like acyl-CoA transferase
VKARGLRLKLDHPVCGSVDSVANPIRLSRTPVSYGRAPPTLGQHTDEVLARVLKLESESLERLRAEGVIA